MSASEEELHEGPRRGCIAGSPLGLTLPPWVQLGNVWRHFCSHSVEGAAVGRARDGSNRLPVHRTAPGSKTHCHPY